MEKKIMNPADIWTTLRLPTCVKAKSPAFSLGKSQECFLNDSGIICIPTMKMIPQAHASFVQESYTETDDPFPVPKIPDNKIPTPWYIRNSN